MSEYGRLQINLLGKPEVWLDGVLMTNFSTAKTAALLYYLAATGQVHSREVLAGLLWGEMPEAKARRNLTKSLSVLRRLLSPFLLIEARRVGFNPDVAFELDVDLLETAASAKPVTSTDSAQALSLPKGSAQAVSPSDTINYYRGDFLEGFFVKDAPSFEEWQLTQRERLREIAIDMLAELVEQSSSQRDYAAGIEYGRRLLELDSWRESAHRQLMLLLARSGKLAAALAQYEQCSQVLADELGVDPMPETTALFQRIRAARGSRLVLLPYTANPLVGRERERDQIHQLLQDSTCRLVTITGLGGMGKSRLAVAAARQINQESGLLFLNGVVFVSLAGVVAATAVPIALTNALDISLSGTATPRQALLNFLRNQEMLLVIDNFEQLLDAADLLLEILQNCPDIKLLVTSREPLNLAAEWRVDLGGLPLPPARENDVTYLQNYDAVALFMRSASQVNAQFRLTQENATAIGQLCRLVGGIPLALQLAATWLHAMSVIAILEALERDLDILATEMRDIPPRQRSMQAVFESTWLLLTQEEQHVLQLLSVCRGGFTQEAAAAIAGANPFLLRRIINRALIYQQNKRRYDMHPLTRQFVQKKLYAAGHEEMATAAHGRYYLTWLINQPPALQGMTPQIVIKAIEEAYDNLQQAWEWAVQTWQIDLLQAGLVALGMFYELVGLLQEGETLADSVISRLAVATDAKEDRLLCRALHMKSQFLLDQGQFDLATDALKTGLMLAEKLQDKELIADAYHGYGRILTDTGRYNEARQQFHKAFNSQRQLKNSYKMAQTLTNWGWVCILDDDVDAAQPILQEALILEQKEGHKRGEAFVLGNLSVVHSIRGEPQKALANHKKNLSAYEELGDLLNLERTENNIGMALLDLGHYSAALPHIQRAVDLSRQIGTLPGLANALDTLGMAYLAGGQYKKAQVCLEEALDSALEIGYVYMDYSVRTILAKLFNRTGKFSQAAQHLQQLRPLAERLENGTYIARAMKEQAYFMYAQGDLTEAVNLMTQAIDILQQSPAPLDMPFFLLQQADFLSQKQRPEAALSLVEKVIEAANDLQHKPLQMRACALAANLSILLDEAEVARVYAARVEVLLAQLEPYPDVLQGLNYLSRYHFAIEDYTVAAGITEFVIQHPVTTYMERRHANTFLVELTDFIPKTENPSELAQTDWKGLVSSLSGKTAS